MKFLKAAPLGLAVLFAATSASAAPSISVDPVTFDAAGAHLRGTAASGPAGEQSVVGLLATTKRWDPQSVGMPSEVVSELGLGLTDAFIAPLDDDAGLRFIWQLDHLPPTFAPEVVRYTWTFRIGSNQYQLQAKSSNLVSVTTAEDPQGHLNQATAKAGEGFYQLRGRCTTAYLGTPASGCYHLAFLSGGYDASTARVWIDLPYGTSYAPDFIPGADLVADLAADMSIAVSLQAAASNMSTSSYINGWTTYRTQFQVEAGSSISPPSNLEFATYSHKTPVSPDGDWAVTIPGGPSTRSYYARACLGVACTATFA